MSLSETSSHQVLAAPCFSCRRGEGCAGRAPRPLASCPGAAPRRRSLIGRVVRRFRGNDCSDARRSCARKPFVNRSSAPFLSAPRPGVYGPQFAPCRAVPGQLVTCSSVFAGITSQTALRGTMHSGCALLSRRPTDTFFHHPGMTRTSWLSRCCSKLIFPVSACR